MNPTLAAFENVARAADTVARLLGGRLGFDVWVDLRLTTQGIRITLTSYRRKVDLTVSWAQVNPDPVLLEIILFNRVKALAGEFEAAYSPDQRWTP